MSGSVIFEERIEVPLDLRSLAEFRRWAFSDDFPERGRIDYINGRVEVDMSPEEVYCHGTLKSEIHGVLWNRVKRERLGDIFVDSTRISSVEANLSAEPDIVFVSHASQRGWDEQFREDDADRRGSVYFYSLTDAFGARL